MIFKLPRPLSALPGTQGEKTAIDHGAPVSGKTDSGLRGSHAVCWWVLVVLDTAQLMVMLDATVVNIPWRVRLRRQWRKGRVP